MSVGFLIHCFLTDLAAYVFAPIVTSALMVFLLICLWGFFPPSGPNAAFSLTSDVFSFIPQSDCVFQAFFCHLS